MLIPGYVRLGSVSLECIQSMQRGIRALIYVAEQAHADWRRRMIRDDESLTVSEAHLCYTPFSRPSAWSMTRPSATPRPSLHELATVLTPRNYVHEFCLQIDSVNLFI